MTEESVDPKTAWQRYETVSTAPIIYFDYAPTKGVLGGAIQVELAARALTPLPNGDVEVRSIDVARLRCSPIAAAHLRDALDRALQMLTVPQAGNTQTNAARMN